MKKVSFFGNEMVSGLSDKSLNNLIEGQSGKIWVAIFNVEYRVSQKYSYIQWQQPWEFACFKIIYIFNQ